MHGELNAVIKAYMDAVIAALTKRFRQLGKGLNGILDAYFSPDAETFTVNGKSYTPQSWMEALNRSAGLCTTHLVCIILFTGRLCLKFRITGLLRRYTTFPRGVADGDRQFVRGRLCGQLGGRRE